MHASRPAPIHTDPGPACAPQVLRKPLLECPAVTTATALCTIVGIVVARRPGSPCNERHDGLGARHTVQALLVGNRTVTHTARLWKGHDHPSCPPPPHPHPSPHNVLRREARLPCRQAHVFDVPNYEDRVPAVRRSCGPSRAPGTNACCRHCRRRRRRVAPGPPLRSPYAAATAACWTNNNGPSLSPSACGCGAIVKQAHVQTACLAAEGGAGAGPHPAQRYR